MVATAAAPALSAPPPAAPFQLSNIECESWSSARVGEWLTSNGLGQFKQRLEYLTLIFIYRTLKIIGGSSVGLDS